MVKKLDIKRLKIMDIKRLKIMDIKKKIILKSSILRQRLIKKKGVYMYNALLNAFAYLAGNCQNELLEKCAHLHFCHPNIAVTVYPRSKCAFMTL